MQEGLKATSAVAEKSNTSVPAWSRSVGSMKCQLTGLVRPKTTAPSSVTSAANPSSATCQEKVIQNSTVCEQGSKSNYKSAGPSSSIQLTASTSSTVSAGLAGLGAYSSSSGSDNDEEAS